MHSYSFEGVIIKRSNLGEADKIVTFFTRDHGKISLVAKGLRRPTSKRAGSLELFSLIKGHAIKSRGSLDILTEVSLLDSFSSWRMHLGRITLGYQLCEVIDKLTAEHQTYPQTYEILISGLKDIGKLSDGWHEIFSSWLVEIIRDLGYWPHEQTFTGDINQFIEDLSERRLYSPTMLKKLSQ